MRLRLVERLASSNVGVFGEQSRGAARVTALPEWRGELGITVSSTLNPYIQRSEILITLEGRLAEARMAQRTIVLAFPDENVSVEAALLEQEAPHTCAAVWDHLPSTGFARHGIYSGSEIYALWEQPFMVLPENATSDVAPGDIAYYFERAGEQYGFPEDLSEICWFYDRDARPSMPTGPVEVNVFARMIGDPTPFFQVCHRMRVEGQKRFRVSRGDDTAG